MATSGTYAWDPTLVDIGLDAFDRIQIRPSAITPDHMFSLRRSLNQVLVRWSNRQVNLWTVEEGTDTLVSGQQIYTMPAGTVGVLEVFVRSYQLGNSEDVTPALISVSASAEVTVTLEDHGLVAEQWVGINIPVAIGGLIIQGFYQVTSVPSNDTFKITAASAATSSASGGAVPEYSTVAGSATITMDQTAHGFVAGEQWTVHVQTEVGGLYLLGQYTIVSASANSLTFEATSEAGSTDSAFENDGEMQIAVQAANALPQDRFLTPISRTDWAAIPSKQSTAEWPTSYWLDRLATQRLHLWPVPQVSAPQQLRYYRMRQIQDANPEGTETPEIPYRFEEALCSELAVALAVKWKPEAVQLLQGLAKEAWAEAAQEDRERVTLNISPQLGSYYR
jgi:hypothetical protein